MSARTIADELDALGFGRPGVEIDAAVRRALVELAAARAEAAALREALRDGYRPMTRDCHVTERQLLALGIDIAATPRQTETGK